MQISKIAKAWVKVVKQETTKENKERAEVCKNCPSAIYSKFLDFVNDELKDGTNRNNITFSDYYYFTKKGDHKLLLTSYSNFNHRSSYCISYYILPVEGPSTPITSNKLLMILNRVRSFDGMSRN